MKKLAFAAAALSLAACSADIPQNNPPAVVTANFDPSASIPVVPTPNDVAVDPTTGKVHAPFGLPGQSASESEFISDYLNELDGFPPSTPAGSGFSAPLDPSSVANGVKILDMGPTPATGYLAPGTAGTAVTDAKVIYADKPSPAITIAPPATGWTPGHTYAVAFIGGANGLKGVHGETVAGTSVWALVRSSKPLVNCKDQAALTDCESATDIIPSSVSDPAGRKADQARTALLLEKTFRLRYAAALDALGTPRSDVALLWTFGIADNPELTFDLANQVIPFPNNLRTIPLPDGGAVQPLYSPDAGHVNLPATGLQALVAPALNTLDGFSTTSPIVSENGPTAAALVGGAHVDPASLTAAAGAAEPAGVVNLSGTETPRTHACLNCASASALYGADGGAPEELEIVPVVPLQEKTDYAAYVSNNVKGFVTRGSNQVSVNIAPSAAFALMRMKNPILDASGKLLIPELAGQDLSQLKLLEYLRQQYKGLMDKLDAKGLHRNTLAQAWDFHTQSTWSTLAGLHQFPAAAHAGGFPTTAEPALDTLTAIQTQLGAAGATLTSDLGHVFLTAARTPNALLLNGPTTPSPDHSGFFHPGVFAGTTAPYPEKLPLMVFEPTDVSTHPKPANGWPVVIFGHGLTGSKESAVLLANSFAKAGYATVAFDEPLHGKRATCAGATAAGFTAADICSSGSSCDVASGSATYGRCIGTTRPACTSDRDCIGASLVASGAADPFLLGQCAADNKCEGGHFVAVSATNNAPKISGWNFIDLPKVLQSFFLPTRDHFRQDVIDGSQLELVINDATASGLSSQLQSAIEFTTSGPAPAAGDKLDGTKIHYVGQSLGGILGTLYNSATPTTEHVVLNVPGGNLGLLLLQSPGLASLRNGLFPVLAATGVTPGSPAFDQFLTAAQWALDSADPINSANHLNAPPLAPATRKVLVQYIDQDEVVINATNLALIGSANRDSAAPQVDTYEFFPGTDWAPGSRHGFLLSGFVSTDVKKQAVTAAAQTQAVKYIATGTVQNVGYHQ